MAELRKAPPVDSNTQIKMDSSSSSFEGAISPEPLLRPSPPEPVRPNRLATMLNRAAGRRGASMAVRENAARQLEERRADWAHSRSAVAVDILWNIAFAVASLVVLSSTVKERPNVPIRVWIVGYAFFCEVHAALVWVEYRRRGSTEFEEEEGTGEGGRRRSNRRSGYAKRCESLNTFASFVWWIIGFYWVVSGGEILLHSASKLYWLAIVFLAFDVVFAIFCLALACMIGIALCCCLPCIIAILYAVAGQEGASDADTSILPIYRFKEEMVDEQKMTANSGRMIPMGNNSGDIIDERILLEEDAECCICLTSYEDGAEIHSLPCDHHFHSRCIVKWLRIHATCPLCKYNILKGSERV